MTSDDLYKRLLAQAGWNGDEEPLAEDAEDIGRLSIERLLQSLHGNARELASRGTLRLSGPAVVDHRAPMDALGKLASSWQGFVTAVGASLEGYRQERGKLPADVERRTLLAVDGISPGSLVLNLTPIADPLAEAEPDGQPDLTATARPLADQAMEAALDLVDSAGNVAAEDLDSLAVRMREAGPRVAGSLRRVAATIVASNVIVEGTWREPEHATVRTRCTPDQAKWIVGFIEGRSLDDEEVEVAGEAITVSTRERWLIDTAEGPIKIGVANLETGGERVSPGDYVRLAVVMRSRTSPDGRTSTTYEAIRLVSSAPPTTGGQGSPTPA